MKKSVLLSGLLAGSLMAGEIGFREMLMDVGQDFTALDKKTTLIVTPQNATTGGESRTTIDIRNMIGKYCLIEGGNLVNIQETNIGTFEYKLFKDDAIMNNLQKSKEERIAKYAKTDGLPEELLSEDLKKNFHSVASGKWVCKTPDNNILFTSYRFLGGKDVFYITEHKEEDTFDLLKIIKGFSTETKTSMEYKEDLVKKYPTYESFFESFYGKTNIFGVQTKRVAGENKLNGNFEFINKYSVFKLIESPRSLHKLGDTFYFCEANGGSFSKDGQPFREFVRDVVLKRGAVSGDYETGKFVSPFTGDYVCKGGKSPFVLRLKYPRFEGNELVFGHALVFKGDDLAAIPQANTSSATASQDITQQIQQQLMAQMGMAQRVAGQGVSQEDAALIQRVIATQIPFGTQQGANIATALYNGKDAQGCDLVAIEKQVENMPQSKRTYNYRVCNGQIIALGETGLPGLPKKSEVDRIVANVAQQCKAYGAFGTQVNDLVVSCKALDINRCNLEINIMQNNMLIEKRVENVCK